MLQTFLLICNQNVLSEEVLPTSAAEISEINNLSNYDKSELRLDPALRRALLRVLNKLEADDKNKLSEEENSASDSQNVVTEEDFIKFFSNEDIPKELLRNVDTSKDYEESSGDPTETKDEILSYSQDDSIESDEEPTTSVTFDGQNPSIQQKPNESQDYKYPVTQPTPQENAIYFQVPEPIQVPDPAEEQATVGATRNESLNVQETRSIQGPTVNTYPEDDKFNLKEETYKGIQKVLPTIETLPSVEPVKEELDNSTKIEKVEKHAIEFFTAPLLAAFTVQQDERGLPRRVIPLNYQKPGPILLPNNKEITKEERNKQYELEEKQRILENQLKFLQQQQLQQQEYLRLQEFARETKRLQDEESRRQQLLLEQQRVLEIEQKLVQARQRQQFFQSNQREEQERQRQQQNFQNQRPESLDVVKQRQQQLFQDNSRPQSLEQGQQQFPQINQRPELLEQERQRYFQNQNQQNIDFQRSVDFQFRPPTQKFQEVNSFQSFQPEQNRINRREPNHFVGNFGINQPQVSADSQLQNLLYQSGIADNLKGKTEVQEDLNIVSKVLALNHGTHLQQFLPRLQFQGSEKVYSVVSPPSTVIQPPKF